MDGEGGLLTILEWDYKATNGLVDEPPFSQVVTRVGIECPNSLHPIRDYCRAGLWDIPFIVKEGRHILKLVGCKVCHWVGKRQVAIRR